LHDELRRKVIDLRENADLLTGQDLLHFLKRWWMGHIQGCDKKYAPYLQLSTSRR
jgi:hemerythrin